MITDKQLIQQVINRLNKREEIQKVEDGFSVSYNMECEENRPCIRLNGTPISVCDNEEEVIDCLNAIENTLMVLK